MLGPDVFHQLCTILHSVFISLISLHYRFRYETGWCQNDKFLKLLQDHEQSMQQKFRLRKNSVLKYKALKQEIQTGIIRRSKMTPSQDSLLFVPALVISV